MCPNCRALVTSGDKTCPYCGVKLGERAVDRRLPGEILGGLIPHARFTTFMILMINFGLYLAMTVYSMRSGSDAIFDLDGQTLFMFGAKVREAIALGQWWRLVTAGFLHGGILHIMMNSWALFDLGAQVEEVYGTSRLIVFYFVSTVSGFMASTWWTPGLSVGASAGLFGLIGAMIAIGVRHNTALGSAIKAMYVRWAVYGLLFGLLPGLHIDNAAHLGGLAGGFAVAYVAGLPGILRSAAERIWDVASWVCLAVTAYSFLQVFLWFASA